jgi:TetR/AcrR family transcriptional regulator, repressor for neighboring sulfatase
MMTIVKKAAKSRVRRTADEARTLILDAAERRLTEGGPGAIRIQDVAAQVGISHPAVLHHFKTREALVNAVVERAMRTLEADLVSAFHSATGGPPDAGEMLERVYETLAVRGHGRLLAWLVLSGHDTLDVDVAKSSWTAIAEASHAMRKEHGIEAPYEDTLFTFVLCAFALFAQAIIGKTTFEMAGLEREREAPVRFRQWLGSMVVAHLERSPSQGASRPRRSSASATKVRTRATK